MHTFSHLILTATSWGDTVGPCLTMDIERLSNLHRVSQLRSGWNQNLDTWLAARKVEKMPELNCSWRMCESRMTAEGRRGVFIGMPALRMVRRWVAVFFEERETWTSINRILFSGTNGRSRSLLLTSKLALMKNGVVMGLERPAGY